MRRAVGQMPDRDRRGFRIGTYHPRGIFGLGLRTARANSTTLVAREGVDNRHARERLDVRRAREFFDYLARG